MKKFMLTLPEELRVEIKREARKNSIPMNEYIVTILAMYIDIQKEKKNGGNT